MHEIDSFLLESKLGLFLLNFLLQFGNDLLFLGKLLLESGDFLLTHVDFRLETLSLADSTDFHGVTHFDMPLIDISDSPVLNFTDSSTLEVFDSDLILFDFVLLSD